MRIGGETGKDTYDRGSPLFKVDVQGSLDSTTTGNDTATLKSTLDSGERVVDGTLHLVERVLVGTTENDGSRSVNLGTLDENALIV